MDGIESWHNVEYVKQEQDNSGWREDDQQQTPLSGVLYIVPVFFSLMLLLNGEPGYFSGSVIKTLELMYNINYTQVPAHAKEIVSTLLMFVS